jgi:hypothetical protein
MSARRKPATGKLPPVETLPAGTRGPALARLRHQARPDHPRAIAAVISELLFEACQLTSMFIQKGNAFFPNYLWAHRVRWRGVPRLSKTNR